ncbi:MAG TPA: metal ABC transporter substrate-binding protein [Nocardioides sp.]|nr:metal ABC transporter substrate-binding protein [Nocardioides sp.]
MRFSLLSAVLTATAVLATGCSAFSDDAGDGKTEVAAAFYPLAYVSERVAEGTPTSVRGLTRPGGEPHDLELDVQTTAAITRADLVVYERDFQPAVDEAVKQNAGGKTLDVADVVDLRAAGHDDQDDHAHGGEDPHFWQDPLRMADLADAVAKSLRGIDPDHAAKYDANAAALRSDLEALDASYKSGLAGCQRSTVVVSHDAFGYLEKYGVHIAPIAGLSPGAEATPAHRAELQDLIRREGITTVFSEPLAPQEMGSTLAHDLGITTAVLDPIEGLTDDTADEDYLSLMRHNLDALRAANGCS